MYNFTALSSAYERLGWVEWAGGWWLLVGGWKTGECCIGMRVAAGRLRYLNTDNMGSSHVFHCNL